MTKKDESKELPSNSRANRVAPMRPEIEGEAPERKQRRTHAVVASGSVVREKKTLARSVAGALAGETMRNLVGYILGEVIIPTGKNLVEEVVKNTLDQILYGGDGHKPSRSGGNGKVSYGSFYKDERDRKEARPRGGRSSNFDLDNIFFKRHNEAEDVLEAMCEQLDKYDEVTVADYFDMAGVDGAIWTHNKWGWKDLSQAYCTHTRRGYAVVLPPPVELD